MTDYIIALAVYPVYVRCIVHRDYQAFEVARIFNEVGPIILLRAEQN